MFWQQRRRGDSTARCLVPAEFRMMSTRMVFQCVCFDLSLQMTLKIETLTSSPTDSSLQATSTKALISGKSSDIKMVRSYLSATHGSSFFSIAHFQNDSGSSVISGYKCPVFFDANFFIAAARSGDWPNEFWSFGFAPASSNNVTAVHVLHICKGVSSFSLRTLSFAPHFRRWSKILFIMLSNLKSSVPNLAYSCDILSEIDAHWCSGEFKKLSV